MSQFFGQFHPLLVHLPIGIWAVAYLFKYLSWKEENAFFSKTLPVLFLAILLSSLFTSISGYHLSLSGAYEADLTENHKFAGIALTVLSAILYGLIRKDSYPRIQNTLWILSIPLLFLTGHFGGSLTHGEDYLSFTNETYEKPVVENVQEALVYTEIIEPIFAEKCWACHSAKKQKGELRLDGEKWLLEGGENGEVVVPHQSKESDLYQRLVMEESDDDHMPPSRKPQLTEDEKKLIAWWIDEGMDFNKKAKELKQSTEIQSILKTFGQNESKATSVDLPKSDIQPANGDALKALQNARISVVAVAQNTNYLRVNLLGKTLNDDTWKSLIDIAPNIVFLNLNACQLSGSQWANLEEFKNLRKLDLSQSNVKDSSIVSLTKNTELNTLNLSQTKVTEKGIASLKPLQRLRNLYLFETGIDKKKWQEMLGIFPKTRLDSGNYHVPTLPSDTSVFKKEDLAISTE
jgi:uncharacterized membrane protein/mono/diheme cytochrome c family protein